MVDPGWNFNMNPPLYRDVTSPEIVNELIHSIKANKVCENPAKALAECRKRPEGKLTNPEKCQTAAITVIDCYKAIQVVPQACSESYNSLLRCFEGTESCVSLMDSYLNCSHPASSKY